MNGMAMTTLRQVDLLARRMDRFAAIGQVLADRRCTDRLTPEEIDQISDGTRYLDPDTGAVRLSAKGREYLLNEAGINVDPLHYWVTPTRSACGITREQALPSGRAVLGPRDIACRECLVGA